MSVLIPSGGIESGFLGGLPTPGSDPLYLEVVSVWPSFKATYQTTAPGGGLCMHSPDWDVRNGITIGSNPSNPSTVGSNTANGKGGYITAVSIGSGVTTFTTSYNHNLYVGDIVRIGNKIGSYTYNFSGGTGDFASNGLLSNGNNTPGQYTVTAVTAATFTVSHQFSGTYGSGGLVGVYTLTTEGTGYWLEDAVDLNDPTTFGEIWTYIAPRSLYFNTKLRYWLYDIDNDYPISTSGGFGVNAPAPDGEEDISKGLIKAGLRWQNAAYLQAGLDLAHDIFLHCTQVFNGKRFMTEGLAKDTWNQASVYYDPSYQDPFWCWLLATYSPCLQGLALSMRQDIYTLLTSVLNTINGGIAYFPDHVNLSSALVVSSQGSAIGQDTAAYEACRQPSRIVQDWQFTRNASAKTILQKANTYYNYPKTNGFTSSSSAFTFPPGYLYNGVTSSGLSGAYAAAAVAENSVLQTESVYQGYADFLKARLSPNNGQPYYDVGTGAAGSNPIEYASPSYFGQSVVLRGLINSVPNLQNFYPYVYGAWSSARQVSAINALAGWFVADTGANTVNGTPAVTSYNDQTPASAKAFISAAGANAPAYSTVANANGSYKALVFDGAASALAANTSLLAITNGITAFSMTAIFTYTGDPGTDQFIVFFSHPTGSTKIGFGLKRTGVNAFNLEVFARRQASDTGAFWDTGFPLTMNQEYIVRVKGNWNLTYGAKANSADSSTFAASPAFIVQAYVNQQFVFQSVNPANSSAGTSPSGENAASLYASIGAKQTGASTFINFFHGNIRDLIITTSDITGSDAVAADYSLRTKYGYDPVVPARVP